MGQLDGKVAIVTGSTSGIGRAIAERFAAEGAGVLLNSRSSVEAGTALAAELPDAIYVQANVSVEEQARTLVLAALDRWGRLDIVVNNAGAAVMLDHRDLDAHTDEVWHSMFDINVLGPWYVIRAAVAALCESQGAILNISSLAGMHPTGNGSSMAYAVAKAALNHLTVLLANSLAPDRIRVNAIAVGPIATPMWGLNEEKIHEAVRDRTLLGRAGRPDELAQAALMLCAPGFVTAEILAVDGGMRFRVPR